MQQNKIYCCIFDLNEVINLELDVSNLRPKVVSNKTQNSFPKVGDILYKINLEDIYTNDIELIKQKIHFSGLDYTILSFLPQEYDFESDSSVYESDSDTNEFECDQIDEYLGQRIEIVKNKKNILNGKALKQYEKGGKSKIGQIVSFSNRSSWVYIKCDDNITIPIRSCFFKAI